jgi:hypothetical protein
MGGGMRGGSLRKEGLLTTEGGEDGWGDEM